MQFGGFDTHFALPRQQVREVLELAAQAIFRRWTRGVIQAADGEVHESLSAVPVSMASELFVYRDLASLRDWQAHGAKPENAATMIHLVADGDGVTIVVGDPQEPVAAGVLEAIGFVSRNLRA